MDDVPTSFPLVLRCMDDVPTSFPSVLRCMDDAFFPLVLRCMDDASFPFVFRCIDDACFLSVLRRMDDASFPLVLRFYGRCTYFFRFVVVVYGCCRHSGLYEWGFVEGGGGGGVTSVQNCMYVLGKAHMHSILSL